MCKANDTFQAQVAALRRDQILDVAARVFAERGFQRTTVREVAQAAGVANGTIYNHFENKTALLLAILARLHEAEQRAIELAQAQAVDSRTFVYNYFHNHLLVFASENQELLRVVLSEVLVDAELRKRYLEEVVAPMFVILVQQMAPLIEQANLNEESWLQKIELMSSMLMGVLMVSMLDESAMQRTWEQLPETLTKLFFEGLFQT